MLFVTFELNSIKNHNLKTWRSFDLKKFKSFSALAKHLKRIEHTTQISKSDTVVFNGKNGCETAPEIPAN